MEFFFQPNGSGAGGGLVQQTQTISNNVTTQSVTALLYDSSTMRGSHVRYVVDRGSDTTSNRVRQIGELIISYDRANTKWLISEGVMQGDAGVTFSITTGGQVQYTSTNISGANYYGNIYFYNEVVTL